MSDDIYIDVNYLTESERDTILQVLSKDEELRKQEKKRISKLKTELDEIKKRGASEEEIRSSRICARCRSPLGVVFNSGALCRKCETRVCKGCRKEYSTSSWLCVLCAKIREVRAESGAWFFEEERRRGDRPQLYGSALVRASFRRAKPASLPRKVVKDVEPSSPPVITLSLENGGRKLHRPVPVHMSRLVEKETEEEEEAKTEEAEVNRNYKQYVKANPIPQKEDEEPSERHKKDSSASSHSSSTSRGSPVHDLGNDAVESVHEETVFDHLVNQQNTRDEASEEMFEDKSDDTPEYNNTNGHIEDELQHYEEKINKWEIEREESEFSSEEKVSKWEIETEENEYTSEEKVDKWEIEREESEFASEEKVNKWEIETEESGHGSEDRKPEAAIEIKTTWHEVAHEWANTGDMNEQPLQDTYPPKVLLDVRPASPDSETTGEFFTPLVTPLHSQTGTPAQSEENLTSGSELYEDAGEATPVKGNTTPVVELSAQDDEGKLGDVTIANPEITCSTFPDDGAEPQDGHRTPTQEDDMEDIDQAFASYERDHPDMGKQRTLQEQLNIISMGSRESIVSYYSDAGEGRFGNIPVTGEVLFGLKYDKHKYQLEVQIHRAKGIAAADEKRGKSDPYVKVYLLPDKTRGGKRKTKVKKNTLDPDFDEILKFKIGYDEMLTRTLWLAMWNHDTFGHNDFLGEVMLPLDTYQESGFTWEDPSPNWYPLQERRPQPSLMSYCGDLTVSLMFEPGDESNKDKKKKKKSKGKLHVQLKEARNLPAKDANGFSDPFVKRSLPKFFEKDISEKTEKKQDCQGTPEPHEEVPLVSQTHSHENLAFEEEEKHLEPKDTSIDSTASTMETTLESTTSSESQDIKDAQVESGDDSGISVNQLSGSDANQSESNMIDEGQEVRDSKQSGSDSGNHVNGTNAGATSEDGDENEDPELGNDVKPFLKAIGTFATKLAMVSPPEIKVDKPTTLFAVAKGDITDSPVKNEKQPSPVTSRRHTDHEIKKESNLSPDEALVIRRHSDFAVSVPISTNEELALADLKRRGYGASGGERETRKGSLPEMIGRRGSSPQWSPRMQRKMQEDARKGKKKEEKRKTLAELASEAGYTTNVQETPTAAETKAVQRITKAEGSPESLISDMEEENYGSGIPVTGELFVSMRYEMRFSKFELHVHSANNLASADSKKGSSDPYVKTYLLPDKRSKRKTNVKKETLNPNFDEILEYFIGYDELLTRTLSLSVWHSALGPNDFLGEVKIPMSDFVEEHGNSIQQWVARWFTLTNKRDETDGLPSNPCELVLALKYVTPDKVKNKKGRHKGELHVHLLEARNLPGMDADGMSDPYCKCYLLPDKKGKTKHKTPIIKRTLNPTFDHKFSYEEVSQDELKERVLEVTIYDYDRASSDEFIGGVRLGLGTSSNEWDDSTEDESQIWHTMLNRANVWIQVVVPLRSSMVSKKQV